jgi:hypothetical protein
MIRKLVLGTASVLALGILGSTLDFSADADDVANSPPESSRHWLNVTNLSKDDIRWAQVELHMRGLYNGSPRWRSGSGDNASAFAFSTEHRPRQDGEA